MSEPGSEPEPPPARAGWGRRLRLAPWRLIVTLAVTVAGYAVLSGPIGRLEGQAVFGVAAWLLPGLERAPAPDALFVRRGDEAFAVAFTTSCSIAALVAALLPAALLLLRAPLPRRLLALAVGLFVVAFVNAGRVMMVLAAGTQLGRSPMVAVHDWFGALLTAAAGVAGLLAMVRITARLDPLEPPG